MGEGIRNRANRLMVRSGTWGCHSMRRPKNICCKQNRQTEQIKQSIARTHERTHRETQQRTSSKRRIPGQNTNSTTTTMMDGASRLLSVPSDPLDFSKEQNTSILVIAKTRVLKDDPTHCHRLSCVYRSRWHWNTIVNASHEISTFTFCVQATSVVSHIKIHFDRFQFF